MMTLTKLQEAAKTSYHPLFSVFTMRTDGTDCKLEIRTQSPQDTWKKWQECANSIDLSKRTIEIRMNGFKVR